MTTDNSATASQKKESKYTNGECTIALCTLLKELAEELCFSSKPEHVAEYEDKLRKYFANLPEKASPKTKIAIIMNLMKIQIEDFFDGVNPTAMAAMHLLCLMVVNEVEKDD